MTNPFEFYTLPLDPAELSPEPGALFIPIPGFQADSFDVKIDTVRLIRLYAANWYLIEKNWLVDLYADSYEATPRYYALFGWDPHAQDRESVEAAGLRETARLVLAARLLQRGVLIGPERVVYLTRYNGLNTRTVGEGRQRFYGLAFGEPAFLPPKERVVNENRQFFSPRIIPSAGEAYRTNASVRTRIEGMIELLKVYETHARNSALDLALRNFSRGQDVLLTRAQRLTSLLIALEVSCGGFQPNGRLGMRVAQAYARLRGSRDQMEIRVEGFLRRVRNAVAHGAEHRRQADYDEAERMLSQTMRLCLPAILRIAVRMSADVPVLQHGTTQSPVRTFQHLLDAAEAGYQQAISRLDALRAPIR